MQAIISSYFITKFITIKLMHITIWLLLSNFVLQKLGDWVDYTRWGCFIIMLFYSCTTYLYPKWAKRQFSLSFLSFSSFLYFSICFTLNFHFLFALSPFFFLCSSLSLFFFFSQWKNMIKALWWMTTKLLIGLIGRDQTFI